MPQANASDRIPKRPFRGDTCLSSIGLGGMVAVGLNQDEVDSLVRECTDAGVDFIDCAPAYGEGEAETKLGKALDGRRRSFFLAGKTLHRNGREAVHDLETSLGRLRTDWLDLFQCHAVHSDIDVARLLSPAGAIESLVKARDQGKIRFLGFTAHSVAAALALLEGFAFDSIALPVNFVSYAKGRQWPRVLAKARERGVARIALKSMAMTRWRRGEAKTYPNCWYKPIEDRALARLALCFSLSEDVTSVIPPGDARLFRIALELSPSLSPLTPEERTVLLSRAGNVRPVL